MKLPSLLLVLGLTGCASLGLSARDVMSAANVFCALASPLTDASALMTACKIADSLKPQVEELLAGKAMAQKAGVVR